MQRDPKVLHVKNYDRQLTNLFKEVTRPEEGAFVVDHLETREFAFEGATKKIAEFKMRQIPYTTQATVEDAREELFQRTDELFDGKNVDYDVYFLTNYSPQAAGSQGWFYFQIEGEKATTALQPKFVNVGPAYWARLPFRSEYVGKINVIRIAPGTHDGWGLNRMMIFYPREHLKLYTNAWIDTDNGHAYELQL